MPEAWVPKMQQCLQNKSEQLQILLQTAGLQSPFCSYDVIEEQYEWLVLHT